MADQRGRGRPEDERPAVDVVLLGGAAASAVARDLMVGTYSAPPGRVDLTDVVEWTRREHDGAAGPSGWPDAVAPYPWLAVASAGGAVVGLAVVRPDADVDHVGLRRVDLEVFDRADERDVERQLLDTLEPVVTNSRG